VHYDDLLTDLDGSMRRLSGLLGIPVDEARWSALVHAATFEAMRESAHAPGGLGVLKDPAAFFRRGASGEGRALLSAGDLSRYRDRVATMAPPDLLAWLDRHQEA
jgi:aryl sulfotransferase